MENQIRLGCQGTNRTFPGRHRMTRERRFLDSVRKAILHRSPNIDTIDQTLITAGILSMSNRDQSIREHVLYLLNGGGAHLSFEQAIAGVPVSMRGAKVHGVSHTLWRLLEHLRICQWDILEFSRNPNHVSPQFPDGYWPSDDAPADVESWDRSVSAFQADLQDMIDLVSNPTTDLFAPIPHGSGQTILREALLIADHNAYHLGQVVFLRRCLEIWDP